MQKIGNYLLTCVRGSDIACRYGGEELTLVFPEADAAAAFRRAEEVRKDVADLQIDFRAGSIGPVTLSLGVALFPHDGYTPAELLQAADIALYQAKSLGRNQVVTAESLSPADSRDSSLAAANGAA